MSGKTSTAAKRRWIRRNYVYMGMYVPEECRAEINAAAARHGISAVQLLCQGVLQVCANDGVDMPALRQKVSKNSQKQTTPPRDGV